MHAYYPPEPQYTFLPSGAAAGPIPAVVPGPYAGGYDGYGPGASGQYYGGAASNYYDDDYSNSGGGYGPYGARQQPARDNNNNNSGKDAQKAQKPQKGSWKDSLPLLRKKKPDQATPQKQGARGRSPSPVARQDATPADAYYYNGSGGDQYSGAYTGYTGAYTGGNAAGPGYDYSNGYYNTNNGYGYDQPQKPAPATSNNNGKKRPLPPPVTRLQDVIAEDRRAAGYGGYGAQQQSARSPRRQIGAGSQQQRSAPSPRKPAGYEVEPYAGPFGQHPYDDRSRVLPGYGPSFGYGYGYGYGASNPNPAFGGQYGGYGLASFGAPQYAAAPPVFGAPAPAAFAASPYAGMGGGYATGWGRPW